jgi:hypothetical protein
MLDMAGRKSPMTVIEKVRRGKRILVIDIRYRQADGTTARLRRDSKAPTKTAAREEEKRTLDRIARTGSPYEPIAEPETTPAPTVPIFGEVVEKYRASFMLTDLKVTTRRGYDSILDGVLIPRFGALPITAVDGEAACQLDLDLSKPQKPAPKHTKGGRRKAKLTRGRRNNVQIVLRSVLRFANT